MISMLIAYDATGNVVGTLDFMVAKDGAGNVVGLFDFEAHREKGGKLRDFWEVAGAVGSDTWPEWIGGRAHEFKVDLSGKRIAALVHKVSGHRRERGPVEKALRGRLTAAMASGRPIGVSDLIGSPVAPLRLAEDGSTLEPGPATLPTLPYVPAGKPKGTIAGD